METYQKKTTAALLLPVALLWLTASSAPAATAVTMSAIGAGGNGDFTVGFEFTTAETITVTHLGKWDWNTTRACDTAIWDSASQAMLVSGTVPVTGGGGAPGALENNGNGSWGNVFYRPVAPVTLQPGTYVIGGQSFAGQGNFAYDSTIATAPGITWIEGRADWGSALAFPDDIVRSQPTAYFGPNFKFASSSLIPVNGYLYDGAGAGALPSTFTDGGGELSNGQFPASTNFNDAQWVGFQDGLPDDATAHPQVTISLPSKYDLSEAVISYLHSTSQAGGTITAPETVWVSVSDDGSTYSAPAPFTAAFDHSGGDEIRSAFVDLSALSGRYVRLDLRNSSQWTFLSEVSLTGELAAGAASPVDVSSYAYDGAGQGATPSSFPDTGTAELTNGVFPGTTAFGDGQWVGFRDDPADDGTAHPQVTFDLGEVLFLSDVEIAYLHSTTQAGGSITAPEEVLVSVSDDGSVFSTPVSLGGFDHSAGDEIRLALLDLPGLSGRYARLEFLNSSQWTFLAEVSFTSTAPAATEIPEPASVALVGLAVAGLGAYARRRRRGH